MGRKKLPESERKKERRLYLTDAEWERVRICLRSLVVDGSGNPWIRYGDPVSLEDFPDDAYEYRRTPMKVINTGADDLFLPNTDVLVTSEDARAIREAREEDV